jgi:hypothetical protein
MLLSALLRAFFADLLDGSVMLLAEVIIVIHLLQIFSGFL